MTLVEPSWDQARIAAANLGRFLGSELLPIKEATDRILAIDAKPLVELPTYETSAMDGYVVAGAGPWKLIGEIKAGAPFKGVLQSGQALGIATGAVIPDGAYGVLRWEVATVEGELVSGETSERKDFRPAGEEAKLEDILISRGSKLNPGRIGLLAASGYDKVEVSAKPKVALILFGDEIQLSGIPKDGFVRDSLGPQIPAWFEKLGCEVISVEYVSDNLEETISAIDKASKSADIVATTGGTADGPRDFIKPMIEKFNGKNLIDRVRVRPGYHILINILTNQKGNNIPIISLPGNPQSAIAALTWSNCALTGP